MKTNLRLHKLYSIGEPGELRVDCEKCSKIG